MSSALERLKALRDKQRAITGQTAEVNVEEKKEEKKEETADEKQLQQPESNQPEKEESKEAPTNAVGTGTENQVGESEAGRGIVEEEKPKSTHPLAMEMAELTSALEAQVPGFATILKKIHSHLQKDPNVVTLLSDEEIGTIVAGLEKHTNVAIVAPTAVKAAKKKQPVSLDDL